jgi:phospholipase/carboxylesterase
MTQNFEAAQFTTSPQPRTMVVFLHGYGADGENLLNLGHVWRSLPDTLFIAPNAPEPCEEYPSVGYQWFSLEEFTPVAMANLIDRPAEWLNAFIEAHCQKHQIPLEHVALVGFSQGAAMALHAGCAWAASGKKCAGVIGYAGGLVVPPKPGITYPPVLLVHGLSDSVWASDASEEAASALRAQNIAVDLHLLPDVDHTINAEGAQLGLRFLEKVFS